MQQQAVVTRGVLLLWSSAFCLAAVCIFIATAGGVPLPFVMQRWPAENLDGLDWCWLTSRYVILAMEAQGKPIMRLKYGLPAMQWAAQDSEMGG